MKKLLTAILGFFSLFTLYSFTYAGISSLQITLNQGWNVVSTPAILSSITFSNGGNGISFSKLQSGEWISVPATTTNIKPLEGYMVYNSNNSQVTMTFLYKTGVTPTESVLQKNLNFGWNLLGIVTTTSPFYNIGGATMSVDFTNNGTTNNKNIINNSYTRNTTSTNIINPEIGEAYGIFINQENAVYGGINNGGVAIPNANVNCDDVGTIMICAFGMDTCPVECGYVILRGSSNGIPRTILRGTNDVIILSGGYIKSKQAIQTSFNITANNLGVESMKLIVNNIEYLGVRSEIGNKADFRFNNISFQPDSTFYFMVDIADDYNLYGSTISFTGGDNILTEGEYLEGSGLLSDDEVMQYIEFVDLEIMPIILTLDGNESNSDGGRNFYVSNRTEDLTMTFNLLKSRYGTNEITFNAIGNSHINSIYIDGTPYYGNNIKFIIKRCTNDRYYSYSYRCEEVGQITTIGETGKIIVDPLYMRFFNDGGALYTDVYLEVDVEINAQNIHTYDDLYLVVSGKDDYNHNIGPATQTLKTFKAVEGAHINVSSNYSSITRVPAQGLEIGSFSVSSSDIKDTSLKFKEYILSGNINGVPITSDDIAVSDGYYVGNSGDALIYKTSNELSNESVYVNITLNNEVAGNVDIELISVNGLSQNINFTNKFVNGIINPQGFSFGISTNNPNAIIKNVDFYLSDGTHYIHDGEISNGYNINIRGKWDEQTINQITYDLYSGNEYETITITNEDFLVENLIILPSARHFINNISLPSTNEGNIVYFATQENKNGSTKYTFWTKKNDDATISNIKINAGGNEYLLNGEILDGATFEINAQGSESSIITGFSRDVTKGNSTTRYYLENQNNYTFFQLGDDNLKIFGTN